jgi:hypothetical protein
MNWVGNLRIQGYFQLWLLQFAFRLCDAGQKKR